METNDDKKNKSMLEKVLEKTKEARIQIASTCIAMVLSVIMGVTQCLEKRFIRLDDNITKETQRLDDNITKETQRLDDNITKNGEAIAKLSGKMDVLIEFLTNKKSADNKKSSGSYSYKEKTD